MEDAARFYVIRGTLVTALFNMETLVSNLDRDNTNETSDSTGSTGTGVNSPHGEHSSMSLESSDSEREYVHNQDLRST
jgi:hypothetical protein